jgi:hypothetical protein
VCRALHAALTPPNPPQAQQRRPREAQTMVPPDLREGASRRHSSAGARLHLNGAADRRRLPGAGAAMLVRAAVLVLVLVRARGTYR